MARPKGTPKTGGRTKGARNKATAEVKSLAGAYTKDAIATLVSIMTKEGMPPQARVIAAKELLDRGHGKPALRVDGEFKFTLADLLLGRDR